jgi:hypothetical protein
MQPSQLWLIPQSMSKPLYRVGEKHQRLHLQEVLITPPHHLFQQYLLFELLGWLDQELSSFISPKPAILYSR